VKASLSCKLLPHTTSTFFHDTALSLSLFISQGPLPQHTAPHKTTRCLLPWGGKHPPSVTCATLIDWVRVLHPTRHKVISETFPKPISWLGMEKQNLTQQKHAFTNQNICTTTQNKHKKTKARFSRLLRYPAWKRKGAIVVLALHKSVNYLLTYTLTHILTAPDPHGAHVPPHRRQYLLPSINTISYHDVIS